MLYVIQKKNNNNFNYAYIIILNQTSFINILKFYLNIYIYIII